MSDKQWLRACSLVVASSGGQGIELGELRVVFKTIKGDYETPNSAELTVYNLSEDTVNSLKKKYKQVILQAGYENSLGVIFKGTIRQVITGRENSTDSYALIIASDGDLAYNFATVNTTLAAGSTPQDRLKVCADSFAEKGTDVGEVADLGGNALPRAKVMYGMSRKFMRDETATHDASWSFQDNALQVIKKDKYLSGEAVVLTHETGLVGTPEQTNEGIKVRCLLNPRLRVNGRIKLDNASIQEAKTDLKMSAMYPPKISADGFYRILKCEFCGDTRGSDWYAELICVGLGSTDFSPLDLV